MGWPMQIAEAAFYASERMNQEDHGSRCESPLEWLFWNWLQKTERGWSGAQRQVRCGSYRVDFVVPCDGMNVVVEMDGKRWHGNRKHERRRDEFLLGEYGAVIHVPFAAMNFYPNATFAVLAAWYPRFRLRGIDTVCRHVSDFTAEYHATRESYAGSMADFFDATDSTVQLWHAGEEIGWTGSARACVENWDVQLIRRLVKAHANYEPGFAAFNERKF